MKSVRTRCLHAAVLFLLTFLCAGCATPFSISAKHTPIYPDRIESSRIVATAENLRAGVKQIRLFVTQGDMIDCKDIWGFPHGVIPCRQNAFEITHTCTFASSPSVATCTFDKLAPSQESKARMVTYVAIAESGSGDWAVSERITYSGGGVIPGLAHPVLWHNGPFQAVFERPRLPRPPMPRPRMPEPPEGFPPEPPEVHPDEREVLGEIADISDMRAKLDIGFFPDSDYSTYNAFRNDLDTLINRVFFDDAKESTKTYTRFRRQFNLWATPFGADAQDCRRTFDTSVQAIRAITDGQAIVHTAYFRDCASLSAGGGAGSTWANAGDADYIFVHESGHFVHGQGDEYCCDGGYGTAGSCMNVFSSQAACQSYQNNDGFTPNICKEIADTTKKTGAWRGDIGQLETMADRSPSANWRDNSEQCVIRRLINCMDGLCYCRNPGDKQRYLCLIIP